MPMKNVGDKLISKTEDEFDAEDIKKVKNYAKAINMLYCAVNPDDYFKISYCSTAKEMWDKLEVMYEGTDQVRETKIDFLTQEDLVRKILRSLTPEWRSKADAIYESIGTSNVTIDDLRVFLDKKDSFRETRWRRILMLEEVLLPEQSLDSLLCHSGYIYCWLWYQLYCAGGKSKSKASKKKVNVEATTSAPPPFPYLDGSFLEFGSEEELTRFLTRFAKHPICPPRVLPKLFPQQKGYHDLDNQLKESGLWPFVSKSRTSINPAFVRAFYSNLRRDGDTIYSSIDLYDIEIDLPTFARVAGLPIRGNDIATYGGND
ncbi:unnamed protein product [Cuscuta campestris]|uniref:Uncharacterized protein n=1 Tax=Cuscuta campestris TaxID=132261 RepID=A0A484L520_9ASTE|nr:unnamed protein product [Cuscuta campestris]